LAATRPQLLKVKPRDVPPLALLGIVGFAGVNAFYFAAIQRLDIGVALTIQYLGPVLLLIWLKLIHGRTLKPGIWTAAAVTAGDDARLGVRTRERVLARHPTPVELPVTRALDAQQSRLRPRTSSSGAR
jgi:EamA-like transporter family